MPVTRAGWGRGCLAYEDVLNAGLIGDKIRCLYELYKPTTSSYFSSWVTQVFQEASHTNMFLVPDVSKTKPSKHWDLSQTGSSMQGDIKVATGLLHKTETPEL